MRKNIYIYWLLVSLALLVSTDTLSQSPNQGVVSTSLYLGRNAINPFAQFGKKFFDAIIYQDASVGLAFSQAIFAHDKTKTQSDKNLVEHYLTVKLENIDRVPWSTLKSGTWVTFLSSQGEGGADAIDTFLSWSQTFQRMKNVKLKYSEVLTLLAPYRDSLVDKYSDLSHESIALRLNQAVNEGLFIDDRTQVAQRIQNDRDWLSQQLPEGVSLSGGSEPEGSGYEGDQLKLAKVLAKTTSKKSLNSSNDSWVGDVHPSKLKELSERLRELITRPQSERPSISLQEDVLRIFNYQHVNNRRSILEQAHKKCEEEKDLPENQRTFSKEMCKSIYALLKDEEAVINARASEDFEQSTWDVILRDIKEGKTEGSVQSTNTLSRQITWSYYGNVLTISESVPEEYRSTTRYNEFTIQIKWNPSTASIDVSQYLRYRDLVSGRLVRSEFFTGHRTLSRVIELFDYFQNLTSGEKLRFVQVRLFRERNPMILSDNFYALEAFLIEENWSNDMEYELWNRTLTNAVMHTPIGVALGRLGFDDPEFVRAFPTGEDIRINQRERFVFNLWRPGLRQD
ncbi:MAG: hypothetical protein KDD52_00865 [Bdellovibrionales bacterium]|nr:hypothetical protein [Bdellovibrionales bacterium]